ncbi:YfhO family protein [soil metagenome]
MDTKRYLPYIAAIIVFIIITALFFSPIVFEGKRVIQGDVTHYQGVSKEIVDYRAKTGEEALWTNSLFSGMPAYQISTLYPANAVQYIQQFYLKIFPAPLAITLLCMVGFYFLLTTLKVDPWIAIAGAIAYGLTSYMITIIPAGHNTKGFAVGYMAPVLMGVLITLRGRLFLGAAITAIALALEIYSNHLQITYYLAIVIVLVGIGEGIRLFKEGKINYFAKASGLLLVAIILAALPNYTNLVLTNEYGKESTRGQSDITLDNKEQKKTSGLPIEYATQWSYGKGETFTLMIPDFSGGASEAISNYDEKALDGVDDKYKEYIGSQSAYFGDVIFTSGPFYVGAIICFLFVLALFIVKDSIKWWLFAATVLAILLAWGRNFMGFTEFFFNNIPGYNKFRAVSMILVIAQLTMPLLAMLAIKEIVKRPGEIKAQIKKYYAAFGITAGICLLVYIMPASFVTPVSPEDSVKMIDGIKGQGATQQVAEDVVANLETARLAIVTSDAIRSFFFILLAGGLLFLYIRKPFNNMVLGGVLSLLVLVDMWGVSHRYIGDEKGNSNYEKPRKTEASFVKSKADEMILQDPSPDYRVLNVAVQTWQDASTSYWHKSIGGYHGAKLKRMQELYEQVMDGNVTAIRSGLGAAKNDSAMREVLSKQNALNMLNTKYIIYNPEGGVLTNRFACGNAWFVQHVKTVANADEELTSIKTFSPRVTAIVDKTQMEADPSLSEFKPKYDSTALISLVSYSPNMLKYASNSSSDQFAVFSEVYYDKGWNAYIDGKQVPHVRADFVLRAMKVPAGKHEIQFKFEPSSYYSGEKIALTGSILLFLFVAGGIYMDFKKRKENANLAA